MKKSTIYGYALPVFLAMGFLVVSCDDTPQPEKADQGKEREEAAEEGEGLEAAQEAIKKREEQSQEESEARREKHKEKRPGGEGLMKASPGMRKR